jgi:hypothetical protein
LTRSLAATLYIILIYSFLQVAEEYPRVHDTLYLRVNYIDRYLSCHEINRQGLTITWCCLHAHSCVRYYDPAYLSIYFHLLFICI